MDTKIPTLIPLESNRNSMCVCLSIIDKELTGVLVLTNFPFDKSDCLNESSLIHSSLYMVTKSTRVLGPTSPDWSEI